jgi:hypothetical protein
VDRDTNTVICPTRVVTVRYVYLRAQGLYIRSIQPPRGASDHQASPRQYNSKRGPRYKPRVRQQMKSSGRVRKDLLYVNHVIHAPITQVGKKKLEKMRS